MLPRSVSRNFSARKTFSVSWAGSRGNTQLTQTVRRHLMRQSIFDKRRKEGWLITFWCVRGSVICQISTPGDVDNGPTVDVALEDFQSAVRFARSVCRRTKRAVDAASAAVVEVPLTSEHFLALLAGSQPRR